MSDFVMLAEQLRATTRSGDLVQINAPADSAGRHFNDKRGSLESFTPGGWVVVKPDEIGERRFRADEILVL